MKMININRLKRWKKATKKALTEKNRPFNPYFLLMENIIYLLHQGKYSCVIFNKEIRIFTKRGVADLYELLNNDAAFFEGTFIRR